MLTVRLPTNTENRLRAIAESTKRTKSSIVRQVIEEALEELEDYATAVEALEEHRRSGRRALTLKEVNDALETEDLESRAHPPG
ncbi:MAG: DUF6290 family protein [Acidobacteria bacterium]|nr:DUF6290 family protein [Acidobacteriota bacterium]